MFPPIVSMKATMIFKQAASRPHCLLVGFFCALAGSQVSWADPIDLSPQGLEEPAAVVNFNELNLADTVQVSAEFAEFGVTFLPHLYYRTGDHPDWSNVSGANLRSGDPIVNTFSVTFQGPLDSAALVAIAQPSTPATITAKLNGIEVESFETTISIDNPDNYFGFTGIRLDEIEISYSEETRLRIDNIQLGNSDGELRIRDFEMMGQTLALTWNSNLNETFTIEQTTDLEEWTVWASGIPSESDLTSHEIELDGLESKQLYFRVKKED
jgi:hypothetical protein